MSLQTTGRINLRQVEKQKLEIVLDPVEQKWMARAFAAAAPIEEFIGISAAEWAAKVEYSGHVEIESMKPDFMIRGSFAARVPSACSRCLEPFMAERAGEFQIFVKRLERGDSKEPSDDPDYWMIESDEIDLGPLVTEQLVVHEPIAETPHPNEEGEPSCKGEDQPELDASFAPNAASPFAALAALKLKGKVER